MEAKQNNKQQENYIARGYRKEIVEVIEKRVEDSDTKIVQHTHSIIKRCIIKRGE